MATHIRLLRMGKKKQPFYRIVAADSRRARDGRFLEVLGTYNPITKPARVELFEDRVTKWLDEGAEPSDTVRSLFTQVGMVEKYLKAKRGEDVSELALKTTIKERPKRTRKMKKASVAAEAEEAKTEETKTEEAPAEEAKTEEAPAEASSDEEKSE